MSVYADIKDIIVDAIIVNENDFECVKKQIDIALEVMEVTHDCAQMEAFIREWLIPIMGTRIEVLEYLQSKRNEYKQWL